MRFVMPIILIGIAITVFVLFSNPIYNQIGELRAQAVSYEEALKNSDALARERDKLTTKDNAIDPDNKIKLQKLLPDNVDNIRVILEIEQIGVPYGMVLKDVKYNATAEVETDNKAGATTTAPAAGARAVKDENKEYGSWDLEFSTNGTYNDFINFIREVEQNLRIVDIVSIDFSVVAPLAGAKTEGATSDPAAPDKYKYDFKIKTYWLKNK